MKIIKYYRKIYNKEFFRLLEFLEKTQYWSLDKIKEYQFEKIKRLLHHAYRNVTYYQQVFKNIGMHPEDIKNFNDVSKIPILTKSIIREQGDSLIAKNVDMDDLIPNSTGGSTGEPLSFFQDRQYHHWADAARIRGWYRMAGCDIGDRTAVLWGAMRDHNEDISIIERISSFIKSGEYYLNAFNLHETRKRKFLKACRILNPKLLRGYVSAVKDLAFFLEENKLYFPQVKGVILCAESLDESTQKYIENVFNTISYNSYGGRELSLIAMECPCKTGLHEVSENNYVEYEEISIKGYPNAGNLIITNLNNYSMPFIRYRIGDIGIPGISNICGCGRNQPTIKKVIGRTTEVFSFYDGNNIAGEMFIHLMKDFEIKEYQFIQVSKCSVLLRMKEEDFVRDDLKKKINQTYSRFLPDSVSLIFEPVSEFQKTDTGKFRFVYKSIDCK